MPTISSILDKFGKSIPEPKPLQKEEELARYVTQMDALMGLAADAAEAKFPGHAKMVLWVEAQIERCQRDLAEEPLRAANGE